MKLPKYLTTVTPFSKALALSLFIILPFFAFYLGMQYQQGITPISFPNTPTAPEDHDPTPTLQTIVQPSEPVVKWGQAFQLRLNQKATIDTSGFSIEFVRVMADNRCPPNTKCKRAGEVSILLRIEKDNSFLKEVTVSLDPSKPELSHAIFFPEQESGIMTYGVRLTKVDPEYIGDTLNMPSYVVTLTALKSIY